MTERKSPFTLQKNIFDEHYFQEINSNKFTEIAFTTFFDIDILPELSQEFTFYIFIGSDSGLLLNHIRQLNYDLNSVYFFIESKEVIDALDNNLYNELPENFNLTTLETWLEKAEQQEIVKYIEIKRVKVIESFASKEKTYTPYQTCLDTINNDLNQLKWKYPDKFQKKIYVQRQIENCLYNTHPAIELKGKFEGQQALILAGGPSLDNYIEWIEEHQDQYIIFAVSRIARRLLSTKIVPDFFVTADPYNYAYETSKEVLKFSDRSILLHQNYANSDLIRHWSGDKFYIGKVLPWEWKDEPKNITAIGPTVSNVAIHLAIQMGIVKHILLGVDLCYTSEGYTHVTETKERDAGNRINFIGQKVRTNSGEWAETTYEMMEARTTLEILATLAQSKKGELINPSINSAWVKNIRHEQIHRLTLPETKKTTLDKCKSSNDHIQELLLHELNRVKAISKILKEKSFICIKNISIDYNKESSSGIEFNKCNKVYNTEEQYFIDAIKDFGINGFIDHISLGEQHTDIKAYYQYYLSIYMRHDIFNDFIEKVQKQYNHQEKNSTKSKKNKKNSRIIIPENETTSEKLYGFFRNNNKSELQSFIDQLDKSKDKDTLSYIYLGKGFLMELEEQYDRAIEEYLKADHDKTIEYALKQILNLSLKNKDLENSISILKILSNISENYLIQLASLYKICEFNRDALDTYLAYIEKHPNDIIILLHIATLYYKLKVFDGLEFVLNHILDIKKNDTTAIYYLNKINKSNEYQKKTLDNKPKKLYYQYNVPEINDFKLYKALNNFNPENITSRIPDNIVGILASKCNMDVEKINSLINELSQNIHDFELRIFYINDEDKCFIQNTLSKFTCKINFIMISNLYDLVNNTTVFLDVSSNEPVPGSYHSPVLTSIIEKIKDIYFYNLRNAYFLKIEDKYLNETCQQTSQRMKNGKIMRNYEKMGFTTEELTKYDYEYEHIILTKAVNYNSKTVKEINYNKDDNTYITLIKHALESINFRNFAYDFRLRVFEI